MPAALVTGASTGIGREFAFLCAENGYDVALVGRSAGPLQAVASEIHLKTGRTAWVFAADLSEPGAAQKLYFDIVCTKIDIELLINNAGFGLVGKFWELPAAELTEMIHLNVTALTDLTRLVLPVLIARKSGFILNVASTAAFQAGPLMAVYYATKAYVVSFSEAIHNEVREHGVKVTCLCPGPTRTEFDKRANATATKLFEGSNVMTAREVAAIGWQALRAGKPLVVAGRLNAAMAFLTRFAPRQFAAGMARRVQETK